MSSLSGTRPEGRGMPRHPEPPRERDDSRSRCTCPCPIPPISQPAKLGQHTVPPLLPSVATPHSALRPSFAGRPRFLAERPAGSLSLRLSPGLGGLPRQGQTLLSKLRYTLPVHWAFGRRTRQLARIVFDAGHSLTRSARSAIALLSRGEETDTVWPVPIHKVPSQVSAVKGIG